ncbi:MAG: hypothetical protein V4633_15295 [Pseudomonadota bacterium]
MHVTVRAVDFVLTHPVCEAVEERLACALMDKIAAQAKEIENRCAAPAPAAAVSFDKE